MPGIEQPMMAQEPQSPAARPLPHRFSQLWVFALIGPAVGLILTLGPKNFVIAMALSFLNLALLLLLLIECYGLGIVPAVLTGVAWGCSRHLTEGQRVTLTVCVATASSWPFAWFVGNLTWIFGGWTWTFGAVSALVCCLIASRRELQAARR